MPETTDRTLKKLMILAAALGIVLRLCCIFIFDYGIYSDAREFRAIALNLLHGHGFSLEGHPTAYRMPGYPFFLALIYRFSNSDTAVKLMQLLVEMATGVAIYLFTRKKIGKREAVTAFCIWTVLPVSIIQPLTLMSEGLFTLLLMLQLNVMSMSRNRFATAAAGILNGLALLIKPFMLLFPLVFALNHYLRRTCRRKILLHTALFTAVTICSALPWVIRNHVSLGAAVINTNGGQNLYIGNGPEATGTYFDISPDNYPSTADEVSINRTLQKKATAFMTTNPVAVVKTLPKKLAFLFSLESPSAILLHHKGTIPAGMSYREAYRSTPVWMLILCNLPYILLTLSTIAAFFLLRQSVPALRLPILVTLFWIGIHMLYFGAARFHYPLLPIFTIAAATLPFRIDQCDRRRRILAGTAGTGFILCALWLVEIAMVFYR